VARRNKMGKETSTLESQILMEQKALADLKWRGLDFDLDEAIYQANDIRNWGIGYGKMRTFLHPENCDSFRYSKFRNYDN
jgi:hypothetical protein